MYDYLCKRIVKTMNINRELSKTEQRYVVDWKEKLNMKDDIILEAVKRTVSFKKERSSFSYVNAILENWAKNNVRNFTDITNLDDAYRKNKSSAATSVKDVKTETSEDVDLKGNENVSGAEQTIKVLKMTDTATLPARKSKDIAEYALYTDRSVKIQPHEIRKITTGVKIQFPKGYAGIIYPDKSTLGESPLYAISTVESDKDSEISVFLMNNGNTVCEVVSGEMIALICIIRSFDARIIK